ncbi:S8 family serine peptidase [Sphaerisporangium fuscum]|uniref:S8 family serine peptidase n=1 Tax=Sphaerisporangium fuscum TaxID=2835868 RepID=UPI001BDCC849|nr:S8 family serine peptidase [Sphaerisporangium fuscum]
MTGDKVVVSGSGHRVEPAPGRHVRFTIRERDGHLIVIPSDAAPLIARGVLDERLFDVTGLLASRYGDADRPDIPIITRSGLPAGARQARGFADLGLTAGGIRKDTAAQAWKHLISARALTGKIWLDALVPYTLDKSVEQIGAPQVWQKGLTGKGVTVAVLDSGYDATHPDLKDVVTTSKNFTDDPDGDDLGHGTHVASIIAGAGQRYRGVAPDARLAVGKVGNRFGASFSAILAGMEWAAGEVGAKVVNMSIGGLDTPGLDPLELAVNRLSATKGTLFVVAAGNDGKSGTVNSPGSADAALTVGAVDREDRLADFSSRGPRSFDHAVKPDITAPGTDIVAAALGGGYIAHSGTSMAAPHVAGAAAIIAQQHPDWNGERIKAALVESAKPTTGTGILDQGGGRVDLVTATERTLVAEPVSVSSAYLWGTPGGRVTTKTVTYHNAADSPVTLDLKAEGEVLKLPVSRLEVPAHGQAQLTLTLDATGKAQGDYPGVVTATAGGQAVRTLVNAWVEPESYDLTVNAVGSDGGPSTGFGMIYNLATGEERWLDIDESGGLTTRLAKGEWNVYANLGEPDLYTLAHRPVSVVDHDVKLTLDARQGKEIRFTLDDPAAVRANTIEQRLSNGTWSIAYLPFESPGARYQVLPIRQAGLSYISRSVWSRPGHRYDLVDRREGGLPEDPGYAGRVKELTQTSATYKATGTAQNAEVLVGLQAFEGDSAWATVPVGVPLPGTLVHHRTPGLRWMSLVRSGTWQISSEIAPQAPREVWNGAVAGPSFATSGGNRTGDELYFGAARLFTDGWAGHTGMDSAAAGELVLAREGTVVTRAPLAECSPSPGCALTATLPPEPAAYTLTATSKRPGALSTAVESVWSFRSQHTDHEQGLPLMAVRFAPAGLDEANRARPGSVTRVPIRVERNPGATESAMRKLTLEVSTDDGVTWRAVPLVGAGKSWTALVTNPHAGYVSLRATADDRSGAGVVQTITRAWAVGS